MQVIGFLAMIIGGVAVWYWRLRMAREAGSEIIDSVERMRGAFKRRQFRKRAEVAPLASIADPAIAAIAFYLCLANEKPGFKDQARDLVRGRMSGVIRPGDMEEVLIFAEWAVKNVVNPQDPIRRFRNLWSNALTMSEREHLVSIADDVALIGGDATHEQKHALQLLRRILLN